MCDERYLQTYGKWIAPEQSCDIVAIEDIALQDVLALFGPANQVGVRNPHTRPAQPVQYLRQRVHVPAVQIQAAELSITAHGLYEARINGQEITDTRLNPGFTSYDSFLEYQTYDVTQMLQSGDNVIAIKLADGWYKGKYGLMAFGGNYGKTTSVLFCLRIIDEDGTVHYMGSDETMVSHVGAEQYSDFLEGEAYNAMQEPQGWASIGYDDSAWTLCHEEKIGRQNLQPESAEPVREVETIPVKEVIVTPEGDTILDFGINIAGYVEMTVHEARGTVVRMEHFEVLDHEGNYYNSIFGYNRNQVTEYTCAGIGAETYHPTFTFYGFRYVRVSGITGDIHPENYRAKVLSTDLESAGAFSCSDPSLNALQSNIVRSQIGNFVAIPTDCPQRERAGWTGDVLVYCNTAMFNQNVERFFRRWLQCVDADQLDNGEIPIVVPYVNGYRYFQRPLMGSDSSSGWGDVIIHLPWSMYMEYGDDTILREQFPYMKRWMDHVESEAANKGSDLPEDSDLWNTGFHFGDWLYPSSKDENGNTEMMDGNFCTGPITATAFYAMDTEIMAQISALVGERELEAHYRSLNARIKAAFRKAYLLPDGRLSVELQGMYVLALAAGICDEPEARGLARHLNQMIVDNAYCLDTGFMSIRYLMDVLQRYGYTETACHVLYQTQCPSWLYEVHHGATTLWETWDAIRADGQRTPVSYNHYAFGCVGEWMYRELLGLRRVEPGWKTFEVSPTFAYRLTHAEGSHRVHGDEIRFSWRRDGNQVVYNLLVPQGYTAVIPFRDAEEASVLLNGTAASGDTMRLGGGEYIISYRQA